MADLGGQLTSWREDEAKQGLRLVEEGLENREGKSSSLSATSFGETDNVAAF